MHAPLVDAGTTFLFADSTAGTYGLGWSRTTFEGRAYISHGGGIFGFPAYAAMLPEIGAGVVVLANGSLWTPYYPHHEIAARVFAHLLGTEPRDWHGGDGQAYGSSFVTFTVEPEAGVTHLDLGFMGQYGRER